MLNIEIIKLSGRYVKKYYEHVREHRTSCYSQKKTLIPSFVKDYKTQIRQRYPDATKEERELLYNSLDFLLDFSHPKWQDVDQAANLKEIENAENSFAAEAIAPMGGWVR